MQYKNLGKSDLCVSELCMGTMMMGSQNDEKVSKTILSEALERGVNFYDTAELYSVPPRPDTHGNSENILGNWLKEKGQRDKILVATKVAGRNEMRWLRGENHNKTLILDKENINHAVDQSLQRLKTDYIDLYQVHWPDRPVSNFGISVQEAELDDSNYIPIAETLSVLADLVKQGKIRYVGISNENLKGTKEYVRLAAEQGLPMVASIQNAYSLVNRDFEDELADYCIQENIGLMPYSILAMGFLSGKYLKGALPKGSRKTVFKNTARYARLDENDDILNAYQEIAKNEGINMSQMAHAFVYQQPFIGSTIIGGTNTTQLQENIAALSIQLSPECLKAINEVHEKYPNPCQ